MPNPPSAYQVTSPQRTARPRTTQQVSRFKPLAPFRAATPPPPSLTTQQVSRYKPTTLFKATTPSLPSSALPVAKFLSKIPSAGGLAVGIIFEGLFPEPAGDNYYDRNPQNPPPKYKLHPPESPQSIERSIVPFQGGQTPGAFYSVGINGVNFSSSVGSGNAIFPFTITCYGPIVGIIEFKTVNETRTSYSANFVLRARNSAGLPTDFNAFGIAGGSPDIHRSFRYLENIVRYNGQPDTGGNPPPLNNPTFSAPGNSLGAPSAAPPSTAPSPAPKAPPSTAPSRAPGVPAPSPGEKPPKRHPGPVPSSVPNPGDAPQPNKYPSPAPTPTPAPAPNGDPGPSPGPGVTGRAPTNTPNRAPNPAPSGYKTPGPADPTKYPDTGFQPNIFKANPLVAPEPNLPNPLEPQKFTPNPKTGDPETKKSPPLITPQTPNPKPTDSENLFDKFTGLIGPIGIAVAGVTALVQPNILKNAANAGTCQAFEPGGCAAPVANNAQNAANNSANNATVLASIMAFLQAMQAAFMAPILAGVNLINTKLGPVMSGINGIGGFLSRTAQAAGLDKALNAMNTVLLLHNAAMLSRNLGSTLGDLTGQALSTIGIKDSEGGQIDINGQLGTTVNNFMIGLVGAEVWAGTKTSWNKASSIVASATNIMYTMRSMFDSAREVMEWTAENTGKIGNSLKRFRVIGENAFKWMPERLTVQNKFTQRLDKFRDGTESLDDAASSLQGVLGEVGSIQSEYTELQEQKVKFDASIKAATPKEREENTPVAAAVLAGKTASAAPVTTDTVFRGEGSTPDA